MHDAIVNADKTKCIEAKRRQQCDSSFWFQPKWLHITASKFVRVAKRRKTTHVAKFKSLLYNKELNTAAVCWGRTTCELCAWDVCAYT